MVAPYHVAAAIQTCVLLALAALSVEFPGVATAQDARQGSDARRQDWFRPEADPELLKEALTEQQVSDRWIYHDLDAARQQAQETGKPILVVFRCVPCGSAPGLDGALCTAGGAEASQFEQQIQAAGGDLDTLLDQFVTVRMVKMNGVNRNVFQFDRDVPYVAMFLHADGTVYGRYGTRVTNDRKNLVRHNLQSFQQSLRRAKELHQNYPQNRGELAAKAGPTAETPLAEDLASFRPFPAEHNPHVKNCIHCHTVGEAETRHKLAANALSLRDVWPFPLPENIGLKIDANDGLKVQAVIEKSPAQAAGIRSGDLLLELAGQPLTSEADIQWVLHHAADSAELPLKLRRGTETVAGTMTLSGDWRKSDGYWRASLAPLRPNLHLRPDPYRVKKGAEPGQMGLTIHYPQDTAASAGLRNGDLLVAIDGRTDLHLEADVLKYIHFERAAAQSIEVTVIRGGSRLTMLLPLPRSAEN